jgi:hypothetical protein
MFLKKNKGKEDILKIVKKKFLKLYDNPNIIPNDSDFLKQYKKLIKILLNKNKEMTYNEIVNELKKIITIKQNFLAIESRILEIPITIYNSQTKHELTYEQYILILEKILPDLINNIPKDQLNEVYSNLTEFLKEENHKIETNKIIENKEEIIKYCESTLLQEGIEFLNKYPNIDYLRSVYLQIGVSKQLINKIVKIIRTKYPKNYNNEIKNAISQKELERHIIINRISLKNYLDNLIQTGHSRREIKQLLIEVGWDDNFVASIN